MLTFEVESHNKVSWSFKRDYLWLWVGLLIGMVAVILLMAFSPAEPHIRNAIIVTAIVICLGTAIWLAVASPNYTQGFMERLPDSGELHIEQRYLPFIEPKVQQINLDDVESFMLEAVDYERAGGLILSLARLWAELAESSILINDWAPPDTVDEFGSALAKAARKPYTGMDAKIEGDGPQ